MLSLPNNGRYPVLALDPQQRFVAVLTPICVEKFLQNSDAQANLAPLRKISSGSL
jgi:hypothetical protein